MGGHSLGLNSCASIRHKVGPGHFSLVRMLGLNWAGVGTKADHSMCVSHTLIHTQVFVVLPDPGEEV